MKIDGPEPEMPPPIAPAASARIRASARPGMSGSRAGSTM